MKKILMPLLVSVALGGCVPTNGDVTPDKSPSETFYANGADISWLTQMESEGALFYSVEGEQMECTHLMRDIGMNSIRLRVWVDPAQGWCAVDDVVEKAKRAHELGMKIMIDFHYSDSWADPGMQNIPKAWEGYNLDEMKLAVAEHTTEVLTALRDKSIDVHWVQVGNETSTGMLWPMGLYDGDNQNSNYAELTQAASVASKAVYPEALVAVHVDQGNILSRFTYIFDYLELEGVDYDMIAMSLYPSVDWQKQAADCVRNIYALKKIYHKEVMIAEIGLEYFYPEQTKALLEYMINNTRTVAAGIFYWEPQASPNYNGGYNKGAFENGRPTVALDAFKAK